MGRRAFSAPNALFLEQLSKGRKIGCLIQFSPQSHEPNSAALKKKKTKKLVRKIMSPVRKILTLK